MNRVGLALSAIELAISSPAAAWNGRGHMVVAAVAWDEMTPAARARASTLLKLNPRYAAWTSNVPDNLKDEIAFVKAATWPDELRKMVCSTGPQCIHDDRYTPADADADLNIGYADHRLRRYWHFKDLAFSTDSTTLKEPFSPNAETQIVAFSESLGKPDLNDEAKSFNLSWLLHLVGDVHQPLHATARFSQAFPDGDSGGNDEIVCSPPPAACATTGRYVEKLHSLWDGAIGTNSSATAARSKAKSLLIAAHDPNSFLGTVVARTDLDALPSVWLSESFQLAQKYAYAPPIADGKGPHFPTQDYRTNAGSIASQQVVIAGIRLARVLNSKLGS